MSDLSSPADSLFATAEQIAAWEGDREEPWAHGKTDAEVGAEVSRGVNVWDARRDFGPAPLDDAGLQARILKDISESNARDAAGATERAAQWRATQRAPLEELAESESETGYRAERAERDPLSPSPLAGWGDFPADFTVADEIAWEAAEASGEAAFWDVVTGPGVEASETTFPAVDPEEALIAEELRKLRVRREAKRRDELNINPVTPLSVHTLDDLMHAPPIQWLVEGIIARDTVSVFGGDGGVGKSATLIELSRCIGTGAKFLGRHPATRGRVLYVAAEGAAGYGPRLRAAQDRRGAMPADSFVLIDAGVRLSNDASVERLTNFIVAGAFDLVVLDTLSQLAAVESENDAAEMARVINQAKRLADSCDGTSVVIVAHTNKGAGGLRGSSAIRDNVDAVWMLKGSRDAFTLTNEAAAGGKMRDGLPLSIQGLSLVSHLDSVVVEWVAMGAFTTMKVAARVRTVVDEMKAGETYGTGQMRALILAINPGLSQATVERELKTLVSRGEVSRPGHGLYALNAPQTGVSH